MIITIIIMIMIIIISYKGMSDLSTGTQLDTIEEVGHADALK